MRASTAYFVGAGTIIAAIAIGLGGGLVAGNIMSPIAPKHGSDGARLERRGQPAAALDAPAKRLQYLAGSQAFSAPAAVPLQAEAPSGKAPDTSAKSETPAAPATQTAAATEPAGSADNAYDKARDADVKRAASEQRRAERRQRWAERRRYESRARREWRDRTDWDDVARNVRGDEDSGSRDYVYRPRQSLPQIRLFGDD